MPTRDGLDDPRFARTLAELRAAAPAAPASARERVLELGARVPPTRSRLRLPGLRTLALAIVPACAAAAALALAVTRIDGGGGERAAGTTVASRGYGQAAESLAPARQDRAHGPALNLPGSPARARSVQLAPSRARLQNYGVSMRLIVRDRRAVSAATSRALQVTRGLDGYVVSVSYNAAGAGPGGASLRVRVPVDKVQIAIVRFSRLGRIDAQRIRIDDAQGAVDRLAERVGTFGRRVSIYRSALENDTLRARERVRLQLALDAALRSRANLVRQREASIRRASYASVSLELATRSKAREVVVPPVDGRIERAAERALGALETVGVALVYLTILLGPLVLLGVLSLAGLRLRRRRSEKRLLASA